MDDLFGAEKIQKGKPAVVEGNRRRWVYLLGEATARAASEFTLSGFWLLFIIKMLHFPRPNLHVISPFLSSAGKGHVKREFGAHSNSRIDPHHDWAGNLFISGKHQFQNSSLRCSAPSGRQAGRQAGGTLSLNALWVGPRLHSGFPPVLPTCCR